MGKVGALMDELSAVEKELKDMSIGVNLDKRTSTSSSTAQILSKPSTTLSKPTTTTLSSYEAFFASFAGTRQAQIHNRTDSEAALQDRTNVSQQHTSLNKEVLAPSSQAKRKRSDTHSDQVGSSKRSKSNKGSSSTAVLTTKQSKVAARPATRTSKRLKERENIPT
ncbi:hypothetical protein K435DRAFT_896403 [Dendrothele bispora CBS 962.96]|uniref:Uncharacterized protein n=1 Tax=Dendrothele bispora (strain CBS 962.96) TaxID=1314807 RepID=A0A4S8KMQ5_DENBC|nr:hypothetical protein K435DRAFT_896403 [Dendrothele bispora CBS 962.96]